MKVQSIPIRTFGRHSDQACSDNSPARAAVGDARCIFLFAPGRATIGAYHAANAADSYAREFVDQVMQVAACNAAHQVEERAARWLLDLHDCVPGDDIHITQERMAEMLGVNRSTVSGIVQDFRERELIATRRGVTTVMNRCGLQRASCYC